MARPDVDPPRLTVDQARAAMLGAVTPLEPQDVTLDAHALGRVLAAPVVAAVSSPPHDNAAMDGFAVSAGPAGRTLRIAGESRAGAPSNRATAPETTSRISTGAALPVGAEAVVILERATEHGDGTVTLEGSAARGQNIRRAGEDVVAGTTVLHPGRMLGPAELGIAASVGAATLRCRRQPRVTILVAGDELVTPGDRLNFGQIYDSNSVALAALAMRAGAQVNVVDRVPDELHATSAAIAEALQDTDLLLLSGGVSVGLHDHVKPALEACGVHELFWRVALRPGKPVWCGSHGSALVLGLPGSPMASIATFLLFARPALASMQGADPSQLRVTAALAEPITPSAWREELVCVNLRHGHATPATSSRSHDLTAVVEADAMARIPAGDAPIEMGTDVEILML